MTNKIFEEIPVAGSGGTKVQLEKQARQLAYDVRYKVNKSIGNTQKVNPALIKQAYAQELNKSTSSSTVKAMAKKLLFGGEHNVKESASDIVANALFKVFVEGIEEPSTLGEDYLEELMKKNRAGETLYWVQIKYKNGTSYTRWADRARMSELRANPNVESVEMVDSTPPEDQRSGMGKDYDGDGKVESGAKEHAGSVHNAIQRKKGGVPNGKDTSSVKESLDEKKNSSGRDQNQKTLKPMTGKNTIKVFPDGPTHSMQRESLSTRKFLSLISEKTLTSAETSKKEEIVKSMKGKKADFEKRYPGRGEEVMYATATKTAKKVAEETDCGSDSEKEDGEEDSRSMGTKRNLIKNKLRAIGLKMSYEPEGEVVSEEESDRRNDAEMERSGSNPRQSYNPNNSPRKKRTPEEQKKMDDEVMNKVRNSIMARYGKAAIKERNN